MVRELLKEGRDNAIGRKFLYHVLGMSDREIRREIEDISETEIPVLNMMASSSALLSASGPFSRSFSLGLSSLHSSFIFMPANLPLPKQKAVVPM